jgi:hypothetical protein
MRGGPQTIAMGEKGRNKSTISLGMNSISKSEY